MKTVLNIGSGSINNSNLPDLFNGYQELRQDIDEKTNPDYCCSIVDMSIIEPNEFDAVFSSHCLEHLHPFDVLPALKEVKRILNNDGFAYVIVPDLEKVAELILQGQINTVAYESEAGPITPLDIIYGYKNFTYNNSFMSHKCGFTLDSLMNAFLSAEFGQVTGRRIGFDIQVIATKSQDTNIQEILERL